MPEVRLLPLGEAASTYGINVSTLSEWVEQGLIVAIPEGNRKLVREDHLRRVLLRRRQHPRTWKGLVRHEQGA